MPTAGQLAVNIGREALFRFRTGSWGVQRTAVWVGVRILDARENFGRTDYLLEPLAGSGRFWTSAGLVRFEPHNGDATNDQAAG